MSKTRNTVLGLAAVASLAALAGASLAQTPPGAPPQAGPRHDGPAMERAWRRDPAQRGERLRQILKLSPSQEPALQTWLAATTPKRRGDADERASMRALTTPQRLDRLVAKSAERQAVFLARADATKRFYAGLTSEQKAVFDAMPMMRGFDRHGRGGDGRGAFGHGRHRTDRGMPDGARGQNRP
jgi:periplasmic protein CpxP/Spy